MVAVGSVAANQNELPRSKLSAYAVALGERIDMRQLRGVRLSADSIMLRVDHGCYAIAFRYGCVVMFDLSEAQRDELLDSLQSAVVTRFESPETELAEFNVASESAKERPAPAGDNEVALPDRSVETLQIVADVLAESVELAHYETKIAESFDRVEPLAVELERSGRIDGLGSGYLLPTLRYYEQPSSGAPSAAPVAKTPISQPQVSLGLRF
jgi:uncharacterized Rmd1/YagE family protein